jgi:hypothetical protein
MAKKRTRGKHGNAANKRRSRRVASKRVREEQVKVLKQLKGLKGVVHVPGGTDGSVMEEEVDLVEFAEADYRQVLEMTTSFTKKIDVCNNYRTYYLPQVYAYRPADEPNVLPDVHYTLSFLKLEAFPQKLKYTILLSVGQGLQYSAEALFYL